MCSRIRTKLNTARKWDRVRVDGQYSYRPVADNGLFNADMVSNTEMGYRDDDRATGFWPVMCKEKYEGSWA